MLYKSAHIFYPDKGIYANQWTFEIFVCIKRNILLTPSRDICQIVNIRNMAIKRHTLLHWHWDICCYYTPKYAIWAFEQFDCLTLTVLWLHITLSYLLRHIQAAHIAWIYLLWWIRLIRQQSVVDCSSWGRCSSADLLAVMLQMMDSLNLNLKSLHSQWLKHCWVSTAVLLVYVFKLH